MFAVIGAILAIGLLIVVHEAGHYYVARRCGMRVDRFSIGFGPPLLKWRRGETDFTLGPIPFGGFVQIHGMTLAEDVPPDDTRSYPNRPAWQRFLTILAGPGTNYLFAIFIGIILFVSAGIDVTTRWYRVDTISPGFDAQGKLEKGDVILKVDGRPIYQLYRGEPGEDLAAVVKRSGDKALAVTVMRQGREVQATVKPRFDETASAHRLGIGLGYQEQEERLDVGIGTAVAEAFYYPIDKTKLIGAGLFEIVTGKQKPVVMGPVGITGMIKNTFEVGWIRVLELLMLLNVYLGLFNLLPLPALDGGRLVFLGYEMATRHRANPRVEATVHMVGIMALLLLMVLVTYQDIARLF
ncbi:MAG TPA: M50 family metallopeptidase [Kofleriaceae bacterium]|nr:M50 family metallopeptidase [Kofleriaceae bacterium]